MYPSPQTHRRRPTAPSRSPRAADRSRHISRVALSMASSSSGTNLVTTRRERKGSALCERLDREDADAAQRRGADPHTRLRVEPAGMAPTYSRVSLFCSCASPFFGMRS